MKKFVFCGGGLLTDNTFAILNELVKKEVKGKYIWLCKDNIEAQNGRKICAQILDKPENVYFIKKNTIKGMVSYLLANYVFYTHGLFEKIPSLPWQKKINLWHGMPLKKIGHFTDSNVNFNFDFTIGNSKIFIEPLATAFGINKDKILKIGSPRNDLLFQKSVFSFKNLFFNNYPTVIWMPTFRKNIYSDKNIDGSSSDFLSIMNIDDIYNLDNFLIEIKLNLLIKLHPMDSLNEDEVVESINTTCKNIKVAGFNNHLFPENFYPILSKTCALITDYSSIYFDYLLLEKPIGLVLADEVKYEETRGFIKEVAEKIDGYEIKNMFGLMQFLSDLTNENESPKMKKIIVNQKKIFQDYDSAPRNSELLLKELAIIE